MRPIYARGRALARRARADFWSSTPVEVVSPLPPDVAEARLRAAIDREGLLTLSGSRPVVGRVGRGAVRLRKRIGYRNSFQTVLRGALGAAPGGGTVFRGRAGLHPLVVGFMALWFGMLLLIGAPMVLVSAVALAAGRLGALVFLAPLGLLAFGVALVSFGRWLARDEEAFLRDFVVGTLGGVRV